MSDLLLFLRENRHIFSICPECGSINRLSDLQLAKRGRYRIDWMDKLETRLQSWETRESNLEERRHELRQAAKQRAEKRELPRLLRKVAPVFSRWKLDPRDVRAIFNPVEFVVFDGMNSERGVRRVTMLHLGPKSSLSRSIEGAIARCDLGWTTIRVHGDGTVSCEGEI